MLITENKNLEEVTMSRMNLVIIKHLKSYLETLFKKMIIDEAEMN